MMQRIQPHLLVIAALLLLGACDMFQDDEEAVEPAVALEVHMDRFVSEAAARGLNVRAAVDSLDVSFEEEIRTEDGSQFCGYVPVDEETGLYTRQVQFSLYNGCWTGVSEAAQEALVFHELGHAVLDRWHREDVLPSGAKASIMGRKGYTRLYSGLDDPRRTYYVDELFDESTPVPAWATE